jgi:hypothetical protein
VVVFDALSDYLVDASGPLVLQASIHEVNLHVVDTLGVPLATARVVVGFATTSQVHDFGTTNDTGVLVTKLPEGYYDLWVYWKDVLVNSTDDLWIDSTGDHTIVAAVYWVDITVLDSRDVPVASAIVTLRHSTGQDFGTIGTDDEGNVSYRLPGGSFSIDIVWQESPVHTGTLDVSSNDPWVLNVGVYYLELTVVDTTAVPVEGAIVTVTNTTSGKGMGIHSTDDQGNTTYRLPTGVYALGLVWQETQVYSGVRTLDGDLQEVLVAQVYYLILHVVDSRGASVEGAQVTVTNATSGRIMGSPVTDAAGDMDLRLPMGTYNIHIVWQETVVHDGVRLVESNEPIELHVAIYYVDLHVGDTLGLPIEGALITFSNSTTGRSVGTQPTDADGNTSYRVPVGTYDLSVTWQEAVVHSSAEVVAADRALDIVARVYYGFIQVLDTKTVALTGAQVTVTNPDTGRIMGSLTTDASGNVTFRLPLDNYTISIVWQETVVFLAERAMDANVPMVLMAYVYYAELHVIDTRDEPLAAAMVSVTNTSSGRSMGDVTTPEDGIVTFRLPMGEYRFRVVWQETTVFDSLRTIDDNDPLTIATYVFYAELRIVDSKDAPVELALVSLHNASSDRPMGDRTTGDTGIVTYRIPMGVYAAKVTWVDTVVYDAFLTVDSNDPHTLQCDVYYPTFDVIDSRVEAVQAALVTVTREDNGRIMASLLTDASGGVTFRLPKGTYTVAMVWQDTLVHEAVYVVESNDAFPVDANIFYAEFTVVDSREIGVEFSQVLVTNSTTGQYMASHSADMDGWTKFRLPIGVYEVEVTWQHSLIYLETWTLASDVITDLDAWVYYVEFHVVDGDGIDLGDARVSLANATAFTARGPETTDAAGLVEFRLPSGAVSMDVVWKSITVYEDSAYEVTSDAYDTIYAMVFYLTVEVFDSEGAGVGNADVNVLRDGLAVASIVTPKNGTHVFRLPAGDYSVNMSFRTTWHLTRIQIEKGEDVDLSSNQTVTFKFTKDEYSLRFYKTNLFWLLLLFVIMLVLIVFLVYSGRKTAIAVVTAAEPAGPIEYTDDDLDDLLEDLDGEDAAIGTGAAVGTEPGADAETSEDWDEEVVEEEAPEEDEVPSEDTDDQEDLEEYSEEDLEAEEER